MCAQLHLWPCPVVISRLVSVCNNYLTTTLEGAINHVSRFTYRIGALCQYWSIDTVVTGLIIVCTMTVMLIVAKFMHKHRAALRHHLAQDIQDMQDTTAAQGMLDTSDTGLQQQTDTEGEQAYKQVAYLVVSMFTSFLSSFNLTFLMFAPWLYTCTYNLCNK